MEGISKEFSYYDYQNIGHIDFDDAKRILILYEDSFKVIIKILFKYFKNKLK
jgi:hypothetical protein